MRGRLPTPLPVRFWAKVDKSSTVVRSPHVPTPCWIWLGKPDRDGYGSISVGTRREGNWHYERAHRVAYRLEVGVIPDGQLICHRCDMTDCVRPDHLFLGNTASNTVDAANKGRMAAGERNGNAKLTTTQVLEIRERYSRGETQNDLAGSFGVGQSTISSIVRQETRRSA